VRVLITGGAGYIGSITCRHLLDEGHEVIVWDTLERGHRAAVDPRAELVVADVADYASLCEALPGCDAVLHCAGLIEVAESQQHPARYLYNNACKPLRMLLAMDTAGVKALVFSSTAAVYGEPKSVPIDEEAVRRPINAYGLSKLHFEEALPYVESAYGIRTVTLRYFNVAGALPDGSLGESHHPETHMIPRVLDVMHDGQKEFEVFGGDYPTLDGTCVRDYIHVLDLAQAHRLALERIMGGGETGVFNLGSGKGFSNLEVVQTCADVTGKDVDIAIGPRRQGDPAVLIASNEKACTELGWEPERGDLKTIVSDAWEWKKRHPNGY